MYCICCKQDKVKPYDPIDISNLTEEDMLWRKEVVNDQTFNVNSSMVSDGIIHIIDAGYGSKHDGDQIILAICDDCIKKNLEDATLLYYGNYMYRQNNYMESFIAEDIEKSKQIYRRRKNLDNLT
jgi:hypothetical protein